MLAGLLTVAALAVTPQDVERRVAEIRPLRDLRITEGLPDIEASHYAVAAGHEVSTALQSVPGHRAKKAFGVVVLNAPIGRVWAAVNDENSKVAYTKIGFLEVLKGEACVSGRRVFQYLPVRFVSDRWWVVEQTANQRLFEASDGRVREMRWMSVDDEPVSAASREWAEKGIRIAYTQGSWFLVEIDANHTLVEYYVWSDPGGNIPAGLASSFASGSISETLMTMERLARDGPTCPIVD